LGIPPTTVVRMPSQMYFHFKIVAPERPDGERPM
jgi:hypothetical protein